METIFPQPSEELRKKLLLEELKLRKKQPEHWAKTKYRKYAKPFKPPEQRVYAEEHHEIEKAEKARKRAPSKKRKVKVSKKPMRKSKGRAKKRK